MRWNACAVGEIGRRFIGTAGALARIGNEFTQVTLESDDSDNVAFHEGGRGRPRSQQELAA